MTVETARLAYIEKMKTYPRCSFINKKGGQCKYRCPNFDCNNNSVVMCALHKDSSIYKRCLYIEYDSEGKAYECPCYHRTSTDFCGTHNAKLSNRRNAIEFYKKNKDNIISKRKQVNDISIN